MSIFDRTGDPATGAAESRRSLTPHGALLGLLWLSFGAAVIRNLMHADGAVWGLTEWSINYEAGFVRRGLPGQLALMASRGGGGVYPVLPWQCWLLSLHLRSFYGCPSPPRGRGS